MPAKLLLALALFALFVPAFVIGCDNGCNQAEMPPGEFCPLSTNMMKVPLASALLAPVSVMQTDSLCSLAWIEWGDGVLGLLLAYLLSCAALLAASKLKKKK